jgi:hypothetical protein
MEDSKIVHAIFQEEPDFMKKNTSVQQAIKPEKRNLMSIFCDILVTNQSLNL